MGSNTPSTRPAQRRRPRDRRLARRPVVQAGAAVTAAVLALGACSNSADDEAASDAGTATEATAVAADVDARSLSDAPGEQDAGAPDAGAPDAENGGDARGDVGGLSLPADAQLAIEARARLRVEDVRDAVNEIRVTVDRAGGRVASANVVYPESTSDDSGAGGDATDGAVGSATLTLLVPPDQLSSVLSRLEELGELTSFDQFAEDVGDQLSDLDTRIENARASVNRTRELLEQATSLQDLVFLEDELTRRETDLERLLATQAQLEGRVALSTLTLDITETEPPVEEPASGSGIVDALGDGWDAFATAVLTVLVGLAAAAPFLLTLALAVAVFFGVRRWRRAPAGSPTGDQAADDDGVSETPTPVGSVAEPGSRPD